MQRGKCFFTLDSFFLTLILMSYSLSASLPPKTHSNPFSTKWQEKGLASAFMIASKLTDPLCCAHRLYRQVLVVDALYPTASLFERWVNKGVLFLGSSACSLLSLFTTLPGIQLRFIALSLQNKPYLHFVGTAEEKQLTTPSISLLSWNLCCVSGGYSITDGGVLPWVYRMDQLTTAVRAQSADVVCLYEIFDIQTAMRLIDGLQDAYCHFYFNVGPNVIGLSSGIFVASKVKLIDPEFSPFPQETYDGRAKHCNKGFFSFDIQQGEKRYARIFATHLQHSEFPLSPSQGEMRARRCEMELILEQMKKVQNRACILTGDLNLEEIEYQASAWDQNFEKGNIEGLGCTWGGDEFCSRLTGKPFSTPLNLDHTLVLKGGCATITTSYIETGFDGTSFNPDALSDHKGLLSIIFFNQNRL